MWIPEDFQNELMLEAAYEVSGAILFRQMLKEYDEDLELYRVKEQSTHPDLTPGYWFIFRKPNYNVGRAPGLWRINEPDGSYCEPRLEHFERLKEKDAWARPGLYQAYRARQDERARQGEKRNEELHREFREKLDERVRALNPSLLVTKELNPVRAAETHALETARKLAELASAPQLADTVPAAGEGGIVANDAPQSNRKERREAKKRNRALTTPGFGSRQRNF